MATLKKQVIEGVAPITLSECVYVNSTETLKDKLNSNSELMQVEKIKKLSSNCKRYKGYFVYSDYATNKNTSETGDFWIWNGEDIKDFDYSVAYPGDAIYKDEQGIFRTVRVPFENHIVPKTKYDVCIIGAGAGGIGTAYALKDSGFNVCLVERLDSLGGTHCDSVGMLLGSPVCDWYKKIAQELYDVGKISFVNIKTSNKVPTKVGDGTEFEKMFRASQYTDHEKKVVNGYCGNHIVLNNAYVAKKYYEDLSSKMDILINNELIETVSVEGKVEYIKVRNTLNGTLNIICADYFVDCSGDGVLFTNDKKLKLDTDYYIGTDPKSRFNEAVYPEDYSGDKYGINSVEPTYYRVGANYIGGYVKLADYPNTQKYKKYDGLTEKANYSYTFPGSESTVSVVSSSNGTKMSLQNFIDLSTEWNEADGYARALCVFTNGWHTAGNRFGGTTKMLAIREKYRVACEKTVDQNYLTKQITSNNLEEEKIIALSTWYVDIHNQSYSCVSNIANGIPYEASIPKCYTNVLVACKAYGASHIGLSSVRLVKTLMDLGYGVGTAIKQLLNDSNTRPDVRTVNVKAVQDEMRIANVVKELEEYFYGDTVDYTV